MSEVPWWRVPRKASKQLELRDYVLALLFAAFGIPTLCVIGWFATYLVIRALDHQLQFILAPFNMLFFAGTFSILITWAYFLVTIPMFILAKRSGYIGLGTANLTALLLLMSFWTLNYSAYNILLGIVSIIITLSYANVVWFRCRKITPEAFIIGKP